MNKDVVLNNLDGKMKITSYDDNKVWIETNGTTKQFCKYTNKKEMETNLLISNEISGEKISVSGEEYKIYLPKIFDWDDKNNILTMQCCDGKNLEFILRNEKTYEYGVNVLNTLLKMFIELCIYWIDFAPRNVLIKDKNIFIVDFEKGLGNYNCTNEYLRNHVYEEYGSFSFLNDRMYTPNEVFDLEDGEQNENISIPDIGPRRIKAVAKLLGYNECLNKKQYLQIIKTFIIAEQPKIINNKFVFPRVHLEQILKDKNTNPQAFNNYALEVLKINQQQNNPFVKEYRR